MTEKQHSFRPRSIMNQLETEEKSRGNFNIPQTKRLHTPRKATHRYASAHDDPAQQIYSLDSKPKTNKLSSSHSSNSINLKTRKKSPVRSPPQKKKIYEAPSINEDVLDLSESEESVLPKDIEDEKQELKRNLEPKEQDQYNFRNQERHAGIRFDIKMSEKVRIKYLIQNNYSLYVHGPPCSGKTTMARDLLEEMGVAYRYIDCIILGDEKYIVSSIISFLRMYILSDMTRSSGKLDQLVQFFRLFQRFKSENKKTFKYYVILDNLHAFREGGLVLRLYLIDRTPTITYNFPGFAEVTHPPFSDIELKAIIEYKIYQNGGPRYPSITTFIIDRVYDNFRLYGSTIEYFVKAHFLIERHLRDSYLSRVGGDISQTNNIIKIVKQCILELAPFLQEDRYKKTYPTRDQIVIRKEKIKRKKSKTEEQEDDSFKRLTQIEAAMMLASYLATYLSEKSDMNNFNPEGLNRAFRNKTKHFYRTKGEKAKTVLGHNFQFPRFQAIFNYMLSVISPKHPELKFPFQSVRQLALLGEFLRGNFVMQTKRGSYRSLITHEQALKIGSYFEIQIGDFIDMRDN